MRSGLRSQQRRRRHRHLHPRTAVALLGLMDPDPNPSGLNAASLPQSALSDAPQGEVLETVRRFQWLLPGLTFNVAFFRHQLVG